MVELSYEDIIQQYSDCVILYKGKPHKVKEIDHPNKVKILDLNTQRSKWVDFSFKTFAPPLLRLGYVNQDEVAVFVYRTPVRNYFTGINSLNCKIVGNKESYTRNNVGSVVSKVSQMDSPEFADMLLGHYPSLKEAVTRAEEFAGSVAFDKQFAVDLERKVFYKGYQVGNVYGDTVVFSSDNEHLSLVLGNEYETTARTLS